MYAGHEPRGPLGRFVMSAAKEIVIIEHGKEHSLNASKEAERNGSGDAIRAPVNALWRKSNRIRSPIH